MNAMVHEVLKTYPRVPDVEYAFYNPETNGHFMSITKAFAKTCKRAEIKGPFRLHDCRHTAASKMIEARVDIVTVSKILGHSSIQMTMRYAHPTPENMRLAVEKLDKILDPKRQKVNTPTLTAPAVMPVSLICSHLFAGILGRIDPLAESIPDYSTQ